MREWERDVTQERAGRREAAHGEMGDEEMALVPGVQYGLSSRDNFDQHKSLVFTKLTDSSLRAIQEYVRNRVSSPCLCIGVVIRASRVREARIVLRACAPSSSEEHVHVHAFRM